MAQYFPDARCYHERYIRDLEVEIVEIKEDTNDFQARRRLALAQRDFAGFLASVEARNNGAPIAQPRLEYEGREMRPRRPSSEAPL